MITIDVPGARRPTRTAVDRVRPKEPGPPRAGATGTTEAAAQIAEISALPALATTSTTESRPVGGKTEVDPGGGTCSVVVVEVEVVVDVEVEVVVEGLVTPGSVVKVVVDVEVLVVVTGSVVVVGSPLIRTTGGCTVRATITSLSWRRRLADPANSVTKDAAGVLDHAAGSSTHTEAGRRLRPLERGSERTKSR